MLPTNDVDCSHTAAEMMLPTMVAMSTFFRPYRSDTARSSRRVIAHQPMATLYPEKARHPQLPKNGEIRHWHRLNTLPIAPPRRTTSHFLLAPVMPVPSARLGNQRPPPTRWRSGEDARCARSVRKNARLRARRVDGSEDSRRV